MLLLGTVTPNATERCNGLDDAYLTPPIELVESGLLRGGGGFGSDDADPFGTQWGRPIARLRVAATRLRDGDASPSQILGEAAAEAISASARRGGSHRISRALADLTVSGRAAWGRFRASPPTDDSVRPAARAAATAAGLPLTTVDAAVRNVLDRAYVIAWNLRGPLGFREASRAAQGWIASVSEIDPPHRPLNVVSAMFPQHDVDVTVGGITVTTRVVLASSRRHDAERFDWSRLDLRSMPPERELWIPPEDDVIVFIQGHSSRAEEALALTAAMQAEARQRGTSVTVLAFDLPSNGYSSMIDPEVVAPIDRARFHLIVPAAPTDSTYPGLNFIENHIRGLVDVLDARIGIKQQIVGVIGGSLGGNMTLRLGYRPDVVASWGANRVSWSPASAWGPSWGGATLNPFEDDDHQYHDFVKHEGVRITRDRARETEESASRSTYFRRVFEGVFPEPPQAGRWWRDGWCDKEASITSSIRDRMEIYNELYRRWHWRIAHEQLIFSHFEPLVMRTQQPRYESMRGRLMLAVGLEDNHFPEFIHDRVIVDMARDLANTREIRGRAFGIANTGHSVQAERPNFWARTILDFLSDELWAFRASNGNFLAISPTSRRLIATSNMVGTSELLRVIRQTNDDLAFESVIGYYLAAENGGGRELVADRTAIRTWERFELDDLEGPSVAIRTAPSEGRPSRYWTLRTNDEIHARAADATRDEAVFHLINFAGTAVRWTVGGSTLGVRPAGSGFSIGREHATFRLLDLGRDEYAIRAPNGAFISAVDGGGAGLVAIMKTPGRWGVFTRELAPDGAWLLRTDSGAFLTDDDGALLANGTRANAAHLRFIPMMALHMVLDPGVLRPMLRPRIPRIPLVFRP